MDKNLVQQAEEKLGIVRFAAPPITPDELANARPAPACIVEKLLYADVGVHIAPGGVGKTTLWVHIAAHIVLARPVFGETVHSPGPVLFITAEDSREILVARLRNVMDAMGLSEPERQRVMDGVRIADVSGGGFKLTEVFNDVVMPSVGLDDVIDEAMRIKPVLVVIDPAVSFGVGESRVNDAEQGLVEAGRKLRNAIKCAVLYVHHSGKANAREGALDQYAGRGGSAFADGSRMVHVLQNLLPDKWEEATGDTLANGESGLILARPKMSYCPPPGDVYIKRTGYRFERVEPVSTSKGALAEGRANQIWNLLAHELKQGRHHSKNTLEQADAGNLTRRQIRDAVSWLEACGRVEERERPDAGQHGARKYLHPVASPSPTGDPTPRMGEISGFTSPSKTSVLASPPYREINGGEPSRAILSPVSMASPATPGEPAANRAKREVVGGAE